MGNSIFARVMQGDVNSLPGRLGVMGIEIQERIKRRSWVCIQKRFPQSRLAGFADGQDLPLIPRVTKTHFPVPSLEIIAKFPHFATQANIKQIVLVSELFMSRTGVVNTAKRNSGSYGETASVGKEIWNRRIRDREGIKRILDWHTDARWTKSLVRAWDLEWIGYKRHSCRDESKNERTYLKSANTVRYLSHRSRVNEP